MEKYSIHNILIDINTVDSELAGEISKIIREGGDVLAYKDSITIIMKDNSTGELIEVGYNKAIKKIFKELEEIKQICKN